MAKKNIDKEVKELFDFVCDNVIGKPLRVTTRERLVQQTSAIQAGLSTLRHALERNHPEVLDTHFSKLFPDKTIGSQLEDLIERLQKLADDSNDTYWATINWPGGENAFPRQCKE